MDMSRKLIVTEYISLDGVIEDPVGMEGSGLGDWTGPFERGPEGDKFKIGELFDSGAVLLGRATYDTFAAVWPHVTDDTGFAEHINNMPKFVVSNSLERAEWNNTTILRGDGPDQVAKLKMEEGGDILVYGSAALVHALIERDLVDEFRLMVYPTVLGRGKRLFPAGVKLPLALEASQKLGSGIMLMRYRRFGEAAELRAAA
jgi:dihydrofolate reductase